MRYVALLDLTAREILHAEELPDERAPQRFNMLKLQAELNERDLAGEWQAYIGEEPFKWPVEEVEEQLEAK